MLSALAAATFFLLPAQASVTPFGAGHLIVVRVGDGSASLTSAATAVFLDEYFPNGTYAQTIAFPTAAGAGIHPFTNAGSSTSEGFLNFSSNGLYVCNGGYGAVPGTAGIAGTTSATVPRVIAVTDLNGNVMTRTALIDAFSGGNIRSVASTDGMDYWLAGSNGGVRHATFGSPTSTQLNTTPPTNLRVVQAVAGNLFVSSSSSPFLGVCMVGTGLPTAPGQTVSLLPGFPMTAGPSTYDYFFANASTLYVADDSTVQGGIQKWTESGGTWTKIYTLTPGAARCRGLTGTVIGSEVVLFATTNQSNANQIVRVHDTGAASMFSVVTTASVNTAFRGIRMMPLLCPAGPDCNTNGIGDGCDIFLGLSTDLNGNSLPDDCEQSGGTPYCFGDSGCPCANNSAPGAGQGCSHGAGGAALTGSGMTSLSADSFVLTASNLPPPPGGTGSILFFKGDAAIAMPFNDGKRCVGGNVVRLKIKQHTGTTATYPGPGDPALSARALIPMSGGAFYVQGWYRAVPSACGSNSNLTNGVTGVYTP